MSSIPSAKSPSRSANPWAELLSPSAAGARRSVSPAVRHAVEARHSANEEAYDRLAAHFASGFAAQARHDASSVMPALERAADELVASGALVERQARRLEELMRRDLEHMAACLVRGPKSAAEALHRASRVPGALASLLEVLRISGDALYRVASASAGGLMRTTGDVTCAGVLACEGCGNIHRHARTHVVPLCPHCQAYSFRKRF